MVGRWGRKPEVRLIKQRPSEVGAPDQDREYVFAVEAIEASRADVVKGLDWIQVKRIALLRRPEPGHV